MNTYNPTIERRKSSRLVKVPFTVIHDNGTIKQFISRDVSKDSISFYTEDTNEVKNGFRISYIFDSKDIVLPISREIEKNSVRKGIEDNKEYIVIHSDESLDTALDNVRRNHQELDSLLKQHGKSLSVEAYDAINTTVTTFEKVIPSIETIFKEKEKIQNYVLDPVNSELKKANERSMDAIEVSRNASIEAINNSSKESAKYSWISILLGALGLVIGLIGYFSASKITKSEPTTPNIVAPTIGNNLKNEIEDFLKLSKADDMISSFRITLPQLFVIGNFEKTFSNSINDYNILIDKLSTVSIEESHKDDLKILRLYIELLKLKAFPNVLNALNLEKSVFKMVNIQNNISKQQEINFIRAELFRLSDVNDSAISNFNQLLAENTTFNIYDIENGKFADLKTICKSRIESISIDIVKMNSNIIVVNSSVAQVVGLANDASSLLLRNGFKKVLSFSDPNPTSTMFTYYRSTYDSIAIRTILKIFVENGLYTLKNVNRVEKTPGLKAGNQWVKAELFGVQHGDIVLRLPNPSEK